MRAVASNVVEIHRIGEQAGEGSFDVVYRHHFRQVHRWVRRLAPSADAEDLCQDVFVVVHRQLGEFEGRARISTWLFQITYRVVGAYVRRERTRRVAHTLLAWAQPSATPAHIDPAVQSEEANAVRAALASLSLKHRSVLILFELEQWTCQDIAVALCVPLETVYSRLHYARRKLAQKVALTIGGRP
jgi:RNA polymerase sigma-70 factor (ECF subfamily)